MGKGLGSMFGSLFGKTILWFKRHGATVMTIAGLGGMATSTVLAVKATPKAVKIIDKANEKLAENEARHNADVSEEGNELVVWTDEMYKATKRKIVTKTVIDLTKLYGPAAAFGIGGGGLIVGGHFMMVGNVAAASLLAAEKARELANYRQNVINSDPNGDILDARYLTGEGITEPGSVVQVAAERVVEKDANGNDVSTYKRKDHPVMLRKDVVAKINADSFSVIFGPETSVLANSDGIHNVSTAMNMAKVAQYELESKGWLSMNDVYALLKLRDPKTGKPVRCRAGQKVGWIYRKGTAPLTFVSFGVWENTHENGVDNALAHHTPDLLLQFNPTDFLCDATDGLGDEMPDLPDAYVTNEGV